jgi:hypothetical protein
MRRSNGTPHQGARGNWLSLQGKDPEADPFLTAVQELSRFAQESDAPQHVRGAVARLVRERSDLLFQLSIAPGEVADLDDCTLSFAASTITEELLQAIRAEDWDRVLAITSRYLD